MRDKTPESPNARSAQRGVPIPGWGGAGVGNTSGTGCQERPGPCTPKQLCAGGPGRPPRTLAAHPNSRRPTSPPKFAPAGPGRAGGRDSQGDRAGRVRVGGPGGEAALEPEPGPEPGSSRATGAPQGSAHNGPGAARRGGRGATWGRAGGCLPRRRGRSGSGRRAPAVGGGGGRRGRGRAGGGGRGLPCLARPPGARPLRHLCSSGGRAGKVAAAAGREGCLAAGGGRWAGGWRRRRGAGAGGASPLPSLPANPSRRGGPRPGAPAARRGARPGEGMGQGRGEQRRGEAGRVCRGGRGGEGDRTSRAQSRGAPDPAPGPGAALGHSPEVARAGRGEAGRAGD